MSTPVSWGKDAHKALVRCELLGSFAKKHGPPELTEERDLFETLVHAVAGQQLSGKAARAIVGRLTEHIGKTKPQNLRGRSVEELRGVGLSNAKAGTILSLAEAFGTKLTASALRKMPDEKVIATLTEIKGIGPWTAEMFLMFALGRPDVMSAGDLGLRKGLQVVYGLPELPKEKETPALFERWRPHRTAASWYLWRAIESD